MIANRVDCTIFNFGKPLELRGRDDDLSLVRFPWQFNFAKKTIENGQNF